MSFWKWLGLVAGVLSVSALPAAGDTVTLTPIADVTLFESPSGDLASGAGPALFTGKNNQGLIRRAILRFDVASAVPAGATITGVEVRLLLEQTSDPSFRILRLHRAEASWTEGNANPTGGSGAPADTGDATWIHRSRPGLLWSAPGGDWAAAASDSATVAAMGLYSWTGVGLLADVQSWLDSPSGNHGWFLVGNESVNQTARRFSSREATLPSDRPALVVTFAPVSTRAVSCWGRIKSGNRLPWSDAGSR